MIWSIQLALLALISLVLLATYRVYKLYSQDATAPASHESAVTKESDALTDYVKDLIG